MNTRSTTNHTKKPTCYTSSLNRSGLKLYFTFKRNSTCQNLPENRVLTVFIYTIPMHFNNEYVDLHCHPSLKPFGKSFNYSPKGINHPHRSTLRSIWHYDPPTLLDKL